MAGGIHGLDPYPFGPLDRFLDMRVDIRVCRGCGIAVEGELAGWHVCEERRLVEHEVLAFRQELERLEDELAALPRP